MDFVAVDVETANADMSTICQIGIARCDQDSVLDEWKTYIDPETYFDGINVSIHGIDGETVKGSPTIPAIAEQIREYLNDSVAVCHTHFDRVAIRQSFEKYDIPQPDCRWLDSARVARRAWKEFAARGYGLHNVCEAIKYEFTHHDALEDAKAAAHVLFAAIRQTDLDIDGWIKRVEQPIDPSSSSGSLALMRDGNREGPLFGEVLVFTGSLEIPRREAADMAARVGCAVASGVTKNTTLLVVGDQDVKKLAGHTKSSKHRKAEQLIGKGQSIRILRESDFKELVSVIVSGQMTVR